MNNYFMETHHHEWILTNRKGSYALGTGNLINQRKYHGLLIASNSDFQRHHLVAGMEEKVEWRGNTVHLDSNNYSNCIYPEGFLYLVKPWLRPYPMFLYSALPHQNDILILKELKMDADTNTVMIKYKNLGQHKLHFSLHPKFTMIIHHELNNAGSLDHQDFTLEYSNEESHCQFQARRQSKALQVFGYATRGEITSDKYIYYNVFYPWEVMSGYPGIGDQITLFELNFSLKVGEEICILFSDQVIDAPQEVICRIEKRYADLPMPKDYPAVPDTDDTLLSNLDYEDTKLFKYDEYLKLLEFSLNDFLSNDDIVAGYPFYGAWGRDTMIVLNAMLHSPSNLDTVERILRKYCSELKDGLIPNMLQESGREANFDSIDATLWFVILLWKLGKLKKDVAFWRDSIKTIETVIGSILAGNKYRYNLRNDGLIELREEFAHGTWMDVRVEGKAVTPRNGAPVEINALWYNAICCYEGMCEEYQKLSEIPYIPLEQAIELKPIIKNSFQKFWSNGYLADRLLNNTPVDEVRPNALLALSLPWDILGLEQMESVWNKAFAELYTPYGIRTLSPNDYRFRKKYYGTQRERDLAYHNGCVWAWLLGAFCGLYLKIHKDTMDPSLLAENLSKFVGAFRMSFMKGHIASLAEVWDGDNPHFPKGAPAQAISVAALYNIESFIAKNQELK